MGVAVSAYLEEGNNLVPSVRNYDALVGAGKMDLEVALVEGHGALVRQEPSMPQEAKTLDRHGVLGF